MQRPFEIKVGREYLTKISLDYKEEKEARCIALYSSDGYLEIAMTAANASKLLGVKYGSVITVTFR
jgi:S-adenosylmethionine hydrolase